MTWHSAPLMPLWFSVVRRHSSRSVSLMWCLCLSVGPRHFLQALAGLVEIPAIAVAMYIITKVGKKWLFCATLFCAGVACCCAAITEGREDMLWLKITFLMMGKFTISAGNTIMPVYTAELYPTAIRNVGVGACNVAAGLALILTPYLSLLVWIRIGPNSRNSIY